MPYNEGMDVAFCPMQRQRGVRFLAKVVLASCLVGGTSAQTFSELLRAGDPVPGTSVLVTRIDNVDVNRSGDWLIALDSDGPASADAYLLSQQGVVWQEGTVTGFAAPSGTVAGASLDVVDLNDEGDVLLTFPLVNTPGGTPAGTVLVRNGQVLIRTGVTPCSAPGLPAGTLYSGIEEAWQNNTGTILLGASVALGGSGDTPILLTLTLDAQGQIATETKVAMVGETLPGGYHVTPIQAFSFVKGLQSINDAGDFLWYEEDDDAPPGDVTTDSNIYRNNTLLFNESETFPVASGQAFKQLSLARLSLNNRGDFVCAAWDRSPYADDTWLFVRHNGVDHVLAHEGDFAPVAFPGVWTTRGYGFGGVIPLSDTGDVLWLLDTDDPDYLRDTAIFHNQDLVLQEGVTLLSGVPVFGLPNFESELAMSSDGHWSIMEVELPGPFDAVFLVEFEYTRGITYCDPAVPNSTGAPGVLRALGSDELYLNHITLEASQLPPQVFGCFLNGTGSGVTNQPAGSVGNLCLSNLVGFYNRTGEVFQTTTSGRGQLALDLADTPTGAGPFAITAGQHWYFQCWYRDWASGTSNFTNAVELVFQ